MFHEGSGSEQGRHQSSRLARRHGLAAAPTEPAPPERVGGLAPRDPNGAPRPSLTPLAHLVRHLGEPPVSPHWAVRYAVGGACALLATVLTLLLWQPVLSRNPFALFYAAVMLSAWYAGLGPGLFATACSVAAIDTFLLPSFVSSWAGTQELVQIGIFGGVALLISSLNGTRKRALAERDGLIALEQSAREEAERARRRSALLADASNVLGASLDSPAGVGAVAERAVPEAGDWCVVDVVEPDGDTFRRVAAAHADPARRAAAAGLLRAYDLPVNGGGVARVIRTGEPELAPRVTADALADLAGREASMAAFVEFGATSYLIAPLQARGRTLGAISLVSCDPSRAYGPHDLRLAEDLAHRLGVALDNARLYRDAQDANRMKDEFLAVVSHELRTPLNAILGWSQLLHAGSLDEPSVAQGMSAIERNARSQARIIDDVLDVSRIIQGKLRLDVQPLSMRRVVEEAVDVVRPAADSKGIRLHADLAPPAVSSAEGADDVVGDAERLRQVVCNLLSNAVKFTPEGGRVDITVAPAPDAHLELRVRDNGAGIDPRFLPHVFERFRQADSSSTRAHGGLGLGLAIVRHLVELHGGSVTAASDGLGRGATFTVVLPTVARRHGAPAAAADDDDDDDARRLAPPAAFAAQRDADLSGVRVLLVEDEPDARELFASMLEFCGAEVTAVGTTRDALAAFRDRRPDVLLSDIGMPGEDGYALIREIRAIEGPRGLARPTPAMAITAFAGVNDRTRALNEGFQLHVPKPVGSAEFVAAVAALARRDDAGGTPTDRPTKVTRIFL